MQLLRLGWFIDSDWEKFDIWLWEIYGFSITFVRGKFESPKSQDWRTQVMHKQSISDQNHYSATQKRVIGYKSMEECKGPLKSDKKTYFADNKVWVGTERLAAVEGCFPTPDLIARRGRKIRAGVSCRWLCWKQWWNLEHAWACWGSAITWAMTACSRKRPRWLASPRSQADVTVRPFPRLRQVTLIFPCVFKHSICPFLVPYVSLNCTMVGIEHGRNRSINSIRPVSFEEIRVFQASAWLVLSRTCGPCASALLRQGRMLPFSLPAMLWWLLRCLP